MSDIKEIAKLTRIAAENIEVLATVKGWNCDGDREDTVNALVNGQYRTFYINRQTGEVSEE